MRTQGSCENTMKIDQNRLYNRGLTVSLYSKILICYPTVSKSWSGFGLPRSLPGVKTRSRGCFPAFLLADSLKNSSEGRGNAGKLWKYDENQLKSHVQYGFDSVPLYQNLDLLCHHCVKLEGFWTSPTGVRPKNPFYGLFTSIRIERFPRKCFRRLWERTEVLENP